jgi:hypothetical protein
MIEILFGKIGKIIKGKHINCYVKFEDDTAYTGGYYVLISKTIEFDNEVYDDWLENKTDLEKYIMEKKWEVQWEED